MEFDVGDRVRFKGFEELTKLDEEGGVRFGFNPKMAPLCGMSFTIKSVGHDHYYFVEDCKELYRDDVYGKWNISADMLELDDAGDTADEEIARDDTLFDMLMI